MNATAVTTTNTVTHDEITRRAQAIWTERGQPSGQDDEIWFEAERQLRNDARAQRNTATVVDIPAKGGEEQVPPKPVKRKRATKSR